MVGNREGDAGDDEGKQESYTEHFLYRLVHDTFRHVVGDATAFVLLVRLMSLLWGGVHAHKPHRSSQNAEKRW